MSCVVSEDGGSQATVKEVRAVFVAFCYTDCVPVL